MGIEIGWERREKWSVGAGWGACGEGEGEIGVSRRVGCLLEM